MKTASVGEWVREYVVNGKLSLKAMAAVLRSRVGNIHQKLAGTRNSTWTASSGISFEVDRAWESSTTEQECVCFPRQSLFRHTAIQLTTAKKSKGSRSTVLCFGKTSHLRAAP